METIKSGQQIIDDFFEALDSLDGVDKAIARELLELYRSGNFTDKKIENALLALREKKDG